MSLLDLKSQPGPDLPLPGDSLGVDTSVYYDKPDAVKNGEKFVVFSLNEKLFAVPSERIAEVAHPLSIAPLPGTADWFLGLANLRGGVIAVLNLKKLWNETHSAISEKAKLIVLRSGDSETVIAFQVDKLNEIVTLFDSEIRSHEKTGPGHIYAAADHGPDTLHLIDVDKLRASLLFD
jgi:purine-binding chemotaxis protein CheW